METLKTLIVSTLVYSWIYGEKLFYFLKGGKPKCDAIIVKMK